MRILGIETSCDETGVAIYDSENGLLAHALHSQVATHAKFGGVVPELASRDHVRKLLPLTEHVIQEASVTANEIDAIAYTAGPGLIGALLVGATFAKALGFAWQKPTIAIHHMEAHLLAPFLEGEPPEFPFLALLVSGGHTLLVQVDAIGKYQLLGESIDDAAGEAFDKTAKLLGLPYPGGVALSQLAAKGDPNRFHFTRPMINRPGLDFSFSGLKTAVVNKIQICRGTACRAQNCAQNVIDDQTRADIARAFQDAVVDTLALKCRRALRQTNLKQMIVAGGVGANLALRQKLKAMAEAEGANIRYPRLEFCTDNGAMIAYTGYRRFSLGEHDLDAVVRVYPRWEINQKL